MSTEQMIQAKISRDRMSADLIVPEHFDRVLFTSEACDGAMLESGVEITTQTQKSVQAFIAQNAEQEGLLQATVAYGADANHGVDGYVEWSIDQQEPDEAVEQAEGDSQVSFYDQSSYIIVKPGDILGQVHQPTFGEDGRDVTGKTLAARDGKSVALNHDESVIVDGAGKIIAQAHGVLDRTDNTAAVRQKIVVDEYVDFNTGNIDFSGDILIKRGVRDCFIVKAGGEVEVQGLIEAATIISGKDLFARGGFAGRERGHAQVGRDLVARYLDNIEAHIRGDLRVEREVLNCTATIDGKIDSPSSSIIGGRMTVAGSIQAKEIGSEGGARTELVLGTVPRLDSLIDELQKIVDQVERLHETFAEEQAMLEKLAGGSRATASHKERQTELMFELATTQTQLDRARPAIEGLTTKADDERAIDVNVSGWLYSGVLLHCNDLCYRIRADVRGPVQISSDNKGNLVLKDKHGQQSMLASIAELQQAA